MKISKNKEGESFSLSSEILCSSDITGVFKLVEKEDILVRYSYHYLYLTNHCQNVLGF